LLKSILISLSSHFFFLFIQKKFSCRFSGNCEINSNNRRTCSSCRLAKCFAKKMKVDLIRCHRSKKKTMTKTPNIIVKTGTKDKQQKVSFT